MLALPNPYQSPQAIRPRGEQLVREAPARPVSRGRKWFILALPFVGTLLIGGWVIARGPLRQLVNRIQSEYWVLPYHDWKEVSLDFIISICCAIIGFLQLWIVHRGRHQLIRATGTAYLVLIPFVVVFPAVMILVVFPRFGFLPGKGLSLPIQQAVCWAIAAILLQTGTCFRQIARHKASLR